MQIRPAGASDLEALGPLFEEVDALHRERLPARFRAPSGPARPPGYLRAVVVGTGSAVLLADDSGDALGLVHVALRDAPDLPVFVPRRFAVVDDLVVAARARRRGIGRALLAGAEAWARRNGAAAIELTVYGCNDEAAAFYRALGYGILSHRLSRDLA